MIQEPIPQGKYLPATRFGKLIFTAGMTPRREGKLLQSGRVRQDAPLEDYAGALAQAAANALTAAENLLAAGEKLRLLSFTVYINAEADFISHARLADFASDYFAAQLGADGLASRAAVGVAALPGNAPVELQLIAAALPGEAAEEGGW